MGDNELMNNFLIATRLLGRGMFFYGKESGRQRPGIHPGQGRLLGMVLKFEPVSQKDLVEKLDVRPSSLSEMLKKLESKGLIERRQDEEDKRNVIVSLSEKGREAADKEKQRKGKLEEELFRALSEEERDKLNSILLKLNEAWKEDFQAGADERFEADCGAGPHMHGHHMPMPHRPHHRNEGRGSDFHGFYFKGSDLY